MSHAPNLMRPSLIAVWLGTAAASAIERHGQSAALLAGVGITDSSWQAMLIHGGLLADLVVGGMDDVTFGVDEESRITLATR